ncbi:MAG: hypothetical protein IPM37_09090 [Hahellaceae bacterium]|nr:hypothetical protein [Hahellaceae bacterium]
MKTTLVRMCLLAFLVSTGGSVLAKDGKRIDLEGAQLKGNEEQPKVLFLIPWKTKESTPLTNKAPEIKSSDLVRPLERSEFRGGMYYRENRTIGDLP